VVAGGVLGGSGGWARVKSGFVFPISTRHSWMLRQSKGAAACTEPRGYSPACSPWGWTWRRPRRWGKEKRVVTGVVVQTGTWLLYCLLPFAIGLVVKHEGMATVLTKVAGKGIPGPHRFQAGIFFKPRLRDHRARIGL